MAKSEATFTYNDKNKEISFKIPIKISSSNFKLFYYPKDLPEKIKKFNNLNYESRSYFHSFDELSDEVEKYIEDYEESLLDEIKEKKIAYYLEGLELNFIVCYAAKLGNNGYYLVPPGRGSRLSRGSLEKKYSNPFDSHSDLEFKELIWSPKKEDWFKELKITLEVFQKKLNDSLSILNKRPELLGNYIEKGKIKVLSLDTSDGNER